MPGKKKKYNARFPPARIKKIMQSDEEVGKVAAAVPVIISRALELFVESLLTRAEEITISRQARTLTPSHLKQCINQEQRFDFLQDLFASFPDHCPESEMESEPLTPLTPSTPSTPLPFPYPGSMNDTMPKDSAVRGRGGRRGRGRGRGQQRRDSQPISSSKLRLRGRPRGRPPKIPVFVPDALESDEDSNDALELDLDSDSEGSHFQDLNGEEENYSSNRTKSATTVTASVTDTNRLPEVIPPTPSYTLAKGIQITIPAFPGVPLNCSTSPLTATPGAVPETSTNGNSFTVHVPETTSTTFGVPVTVSSSSFVVPVPQISCTSTGVSVTASTNCTTSVGVPVSVITSLHKAQGANSNLQNLSRSTSLSTEVDEDYDC